MTGKLTHADLVRGARRAERAMAKWPKWKRDLSLSTLRGMPPRPLEYDPDTLDKCAGIAPDWM